MLARDQRCAMGIGPALNRASAPSRASPWLLRSTRRKGRATWISASARLRRLANVTKRYLIATAAHNLGRILRKLFGVGKPKVLQGRSGLAALMQLAMGWSITILAVLKYLSEFQRLQSATTRLR